MSTTEQPLTTCHDTFTLERDYPVPPARVYAAFAETEARRAWFVPPAEGGVAEYSLDFRVGGNEHLVGDHGGGTFSYDATFHDLVPDQRLIYSYYMYIDGVKVSVSLATVVLTPADDGVSTHLTLTEHGAFLEDFGKPNDREEGTVHLLDSLRRALAA